MPAIEYSHHRSNDLMAVFFNCDNTNIVLCHDAANPITGPHEQEERPLHTRAAVRRKTFSRLTTTYLNALRLKFSSSTTSFTPSTRTDASPSRAEHPLKAGVGVVSTRPPQQSRKEGRCSRYHLQGHIPWIASLWPTFALSPQIPYDVGNRRYRYARRNTPGLH